MWEWVLLGVAWAAIGVRFAVLDWTLEVDLRVRDVPVILVAGCLVGPIMIIVYYFDRKAESELGNKVLMKKREV